MTLSESDICKLVEEVSALCSKADLAAAGTSEYLQMIDNILQDYREFFPEETEVKYRLKKRLGQIELILIVRGDRMNPFEQGSRSQSFSTGRQIWPLLQDPFAAVHYRYLSGRNIITVLSSSIIDDRGILRQPMVQAVILGLIAGLICKQFPAGVSSVLANDIASPVLSVLLKMTAGIMGPVVFLSLVIAVSALDDVSELSDWGAKIFRRLGKIAIFLTLMSMVVAVVMFPILGKSSIQLKVRPLMDLLLSIIPTNLFAPFVSNNVPQIVILGLCLGAALLLISSRVPQLISLLTDIRDWLNELMHLINKIMPAVPCLSIFTLVAGNKASAMLAGWKYILAVYICLLISIVLKFIKVSVKCKIPVKDMAGRIRPLAFTAFATGSEASGMGRFKEMLVEDFGAEEKFSSFWIPLNQVMLKPSSTITFVLGSFFVAEITGTPASLNFLVILFILTVQLSLASPGLTPGLTLLFEALSLPTEYVGLFSAYGIFIKNAASSYGITYRILEGIEAAQELNVRQINKDGQC